MESKTVDILLLVLIVLILGVYFGVRHQVYQKYNFAEQIEKTEQFVRAEKWKEARESGKKVKAQWDKVREVTAMNYAEADLMTLEEHLHLLIGGIEDKDRASAMGSIGYIKETWRNIQKFVPRP